MVNGKLVVENMSEDELNQAWITASDVAKERRQGQGQEEVARSLGQQGGHFRRVVGKLFGFHSRHDGGRTMVESPKTTLGLTYPELGGLEAVIFQKIWA